MGDMGGAVTDVEPWNIKVGILGKPIGSGIYNIF